MAPQPRMRRAMSDATSSSSGSGESEESTPRKVQDISDSEDDGMKRPRRALSDDDDVAGGMLDPDGDDDDMEDVQSAGLHTTTPTPFTRTLRPNRGAVYTSKPPCRFTRQRNSTDGRRKSSRISKVEASPPQADDIRCVCPARFMKERKRLGICMICDVIHHYACVARTASGVSSFMCLECPGGLLKDIPDRVAGRKSSSKRVSTHTPAVLLPPSKVKKPVLSLNTDAATKTTSNQIQPAASLARPNLRQRPILNPSDSSPRLHHQPTKKPSPLTAQYNTLLTTLLRKSDQLSHQKKKKQPRGEQTRTTNLAKCFLENIPLPALWRHYCLIPPSPATTAAVTQATDVHFVDYRTVPVHAAPELWAKELQYRLRLLLDAVTASGGEQGRVVVLEPQQWERDVGLALRHLRDLAREVVHHGSYRGKRARLGVLGEVLGLSEKGAFWRGGEEFVGGEVV